MSVGIEAGEKSEQLSVALGIVRNHVGVGGKVCSLTNNCVAHNL